MNDFKEVTTGEVSFKILELEKPFIGTFSRIVEPAKEGEPKRISGLFMHDQDGAELCLGDGYQLIKFFNENPQYQKNHLVRITLKGQQDVKGGRKVNVYNFAEKEIPESSDLN